MYNKAVKRIRSAQPAGIPAGFYYADGFGNGREGEQKELSVIRKKERNMTRREEQNAKYMQNKQKEPQNFSE